MTYYFITGFLACLIGYTLGRLRTRQAYIAAVARLRIKHREDIESLVESMDAIKQVVIRHPDGDFILSGEN